MNFLKSIRSLLLLSVSSLVLFQSSLAFDDLPSRPDRPIVAFHFVLRFMDLNEAKALIDKVDNAGYNTVIMQLTRGGVDFNQKTWDPITPDEEIVPLTRAEFVELVEYTKQKKLDIVPELKLFTHQEKLFNKNHPDLMFNSKTYDPSKNEVYAEVVPLISEIISIVKPYAFHIGHDEIPKYSPGEPGEPLPSHSLESPDEPTPPGELFKMSVNRLQKIINNRWGIETWIWGDMLIHPDEFPEMFSTHLHADRGVGYGKTLRDGLTKDLTVLDWHYFGNTTKFTSGKVLKEEGFDVLGSTWKTQNIIEDHTKWAAEHDYSGMVATSWVHAFPFRTEDRVLLNEKIIKNSARIFNEHFRGKVFENLPTRPDGPIFAFHYVARGISLEEQKVLMDRIAKAGYNTVIIQITQGIQLSNAPWKPLPDALTRDEFIELVDYTKGKGLQIIPELKLFTHQEKFLDGSKAEHAALMFNSKTYDPRKEGVYKIVVPLMAEIISIVRPYAFHVGHDEVSKYRGLNDDGTPKLANLSLREDETVAHGGLYKRSINRLEETITRKWGIETWVWGDMLISPQEFPEMFHVHLHANTGQWFGRTLRESITKNLTVIDWHYFGKTTEFSSGTTFQDLGFDVVGSTWRTPTITENQTKWAAEHDYSGMVSTSWNRLRPGQHKNYSEEVVEWFIEDAAATYKKYFK